MSLLELSYSEFEHEERSWKVSEASFSKINLIVGKNSSGKSRLTSVINSFARTITGQHMPNEKCRFHAILKLNGRRFSYEITFENSSVMEEKLEIENVAKLTRRADGSGSIFYEKENKYLDFKLPLNAIASLSKRDEIQHQYLIELYDWASSTSIFLFGSELGKSQLMNIYDAQVLFGSPNPKIIDDVNNLIGLYTTAFQTYGETFDEAIIDDMNRLGYSLTEVGCTDLKTINPNFPVAALTMFTVEKDLGFKNPQGLMSQGMFRALALTIHLNLCAFSGSKKLILIDDIGEGLDYERSVSIINLLIDKAEQSGLQLIMTTNDRFVMNEVPLEYWSILSRKGGVVSLFNERNSPSEFDQFKFLGLNNFDFFASNAFDKKDAK
jgi:energy-coupling factor transporter ATP-binding protein EcfA2